MTAAHAHPDRDRLRVSVGAHPALTFRTATVSVNGVARKVVVAGHFAAGELSPSYALSRNVRVATYYLYLRGLDADVTRHTHFVAARAGLANLRLTARFVVRFDPITPNLPPRSRTSLNFCATAISARVQDTGSSFPFTRIIGDWSRSSLCRKSNA